MKKMGDNESNVIMVSLHAMHFARLVTCRGAWWHLDYEYHSPKNYIHILKRFWLKPVKLKKILSLSALSLFCHDDCEKSIVLQVESLKTRMVRDFTYLDSILIHAGICPTARKQRNQSGPAMFFGSFDKGITKQKTWYCSSFIPAQLIQGRFLPAFVIDHSCGCHQSTRFPAPPPRFLSSFGSLINDVAILWIFES